MEKSSAGILVSILFMGFVVPSLAIVYTVGDSAGWALSVDYGAWASGKTFNVGDSLVFNYPSGHRVDEVTASDYQSCTVGNSITSDSNGVTTIPLNTAGTHYFICGVIDHCSGGMKLAVTVVAAGDSGGTSTASHASVSATLTPYFPLLFSGVVAILNYLVIA